MTRDDVARRKMQKRHDQLGSWRAVADLPEYAGLSFATLAAYAGGRPIVNPHHRHLLGLPALAPAPVCASCGVVHVGRCPRRKVAWSERPLREQPVELLRWRLENREEMK